MESLEFLEMLVRILQDKSAKSIQNKSKDILAHLRQGHKICHLKKALYGLRQAGRQWYAKLSKVLKDASLTPTNADPVFTLIKTRQSSCWFMLTTYYLFREI